MKVTRHDSDQAPNIVLIATVISILVAGSRAWLNNIIGWIDPWLFQGYFWHYFAHVVDYDNYYKVSRLPWIIPGALTHLVFSFPLNHYVLVLSFILGTAVFFYLGLSKIFNPTSALVTTVFFITTPFTLGSGGIDYQNTGLGFYWAATFWLLCSGPRKDYSRKALWAIGALFACCVHINTYFGIFIVPLILFWFLADSPKQNKKSFFNFGFNIFLGGVAITVLFALIHFVTGGRRLFFMPQIEFVRWLSKKNTWYLPFRQWGPQAFHIALPLATLLVGSLFFKIRNFKTLLKEPRSNFLVQFFWVFLVLALAQARKQTLLQSNYMTYPLQLAMLPVLCSIFSSFFETLMQNWKFRKRFVLEIGLIAVAILTLWFPWESGIFDLLPGFSEVVLVVAVFFLSLSALFNLKKLSIGKGPVAVVALFLFFLAHSREIRLSGYGNPSPYSPRDSHCSITHEALGLFNQIDHAVTQFDPLIQTKFWFDSKETTVPNQDSRCAPVNMGEVFSSYAYSRIWYGTFWALPKDNSIESIDRQEVKQKAFNQARALAILTTDPDKTEAFLEKMKSLHVSMSGVERFPFNHTQVHLFLGRNPTLEP